jgi:hypothetical protein
MKKTFTLILFFSIAHAILACDFCNCYLGLNPQYKKNTFGLRYHSMFYRGSHMTNEELQGTGISVNDFLESRTNIEVHGQFYPTQKIQVVYSLPYVMSHEYTTMNHHHGEDGEGEHLAGIGDPLFIANFQLFNRTETDSSNYSQRLLAGGGIKFPIGNWKLEEDAEACERVHLPGTGSWDYIASAVYLGKYNRTGFNLNVTYLITTSNKQQFRFANRFNANLTAYYQIKKKETMLYPNAGAYLEQAGKDIDGESALQNSGGSILFAHTGFDIYFKKFSLNTAFQIPVVQQLNSNQPALQHRIIAGITYAFN